MQELKIEFKAPEELKFKKKHTKKHPQKQIRKIAKSFKVFKNIVPILIDENNVILAGEARVKAALYLKLEKIPVIPISHLSEVEKKAFIIADNKLAEEGKWNYDNLKIEFKNLLEIDSIDFDILSTGFEIGEIDQICFTNTVSTRIDKDDELNYEKVKRLVSTGDIWQLGSHLLICGDSRDPKTYQQVLKNDKANLVIADLPYNVHIKNNVSKCINEDFMCASGELSFTEFENFLSTVIKNLIDYSIDGSLHYNFIDWRHIEELSSAGKQYSELKNICVWDKLVAGLGSFYRSQHEFIFVYKNGTSKNINNIELGKFGRVRSNIWQYKGMHASNPESKELNKLHPTVKPTPLIMDIILDASNPKDIILDPFCGSGTTLIAAEKLHRQARLIEISPKYCDVIIYRWEKLTNQKAIKLTGDTNE